MIRTFYAYLFFFFYNSVNKVKGNILVQFKALFLILALECLLLLSIVVPYVNITKVVVTANLNVLEPLWVLVPLVGLKMWFFERNGRWKGFLTEFDAWPPKKRKKWDWAVRVMIFLIVGNLIFSFYQMSQIDWRLRR